MSRPAFRIIPGDLKKAHKGMPSLATPSADGAKGLCGHDSDALAIQAERRILMIRGMKVMMSYDLAELYAEKNSALNRAVKRSADRFPKDFMFQLSDQEWTALKCQIGRSSSADITMQAGIQRWGGNRVAPYAFTERGVAMLSSVLRSRRAVQANIAIMRAFVRLREMLLANAVLARKLAVLESKYEVICWACHSSPSEIERLG
jgi:hypothetical protein